MNTLDGAPRPEGLDDVVEALRALFGVPDPLVAGRDARVRRLALEALITLNDVDDTVVERAADDGDAQVRRLAMSAVSRLDGRFADDTAGRVLRKGLADAVPMVRLEAVHAEAARDTGSPAACALALGETADPDIHVVLAAIDALAVCGTSSDAVALLARATQDLSTVNEPRGWHRTAHALVALAGAAPERAMAMLGQFTVSTRPPLRLYAAKAAATLNDRATLDILSKDGDREVAEEAGRQLARLTGDAPASTPGPRSAKKSPSTVPAVPTVLTGADLKRLAAPRARVVVRGVGSFELALFTAEAPATVLRFARLAGSGYYDGLDIERVLPNFIVQTRTPPGALANDVADATFPARGARAVAARARRRRAVGRRTRRRANLHRPRGQSTLRSSVHGVRAGAERPRRRGRAARRRCRRSDRDRSRPVSAAMFSRRLPDDLARNRLARALDERRGGGRAFIDLTESNPTRAGFAYPPDLLAALGDGRALAYAPRPARRRREARRAVAADYARRGLSVAPDRIVLTAGTSEAYSLLFKVLCEPGDEVLTPRPSYPLFQHLTRLDAVVATPHATSSITAPGRSICPAWSAPLPIARARCSS